MRRKMLALSLTAGALTIPATPIVVGLLLRSWRFRWRNAITAENSGVVLTPEELSAGRRGSEASRRLGCCPASGRLR